MPNSSNDMPEINGIAYTWSNVTANIAGLKIHNLRAISYSDAQEMANVYGAGQLPVARSYGKISSKASITLLRAEVEAISNAIPTGRLQDAPPFDIIVQFMMGDDQMTTHRIRNAQFKGNSFDAAEKNGTTAIETAFELIVSHIEWK